MAYAVDDTRWPLVVARTIPFSAETLAASYRTLEALLERKQPFVVLFDMRGATSSSERRRKFMEFGERHADAIKHYLAASAVVASSPLERGFVTAVLWVKTPPFPMRVFASSTDAEAWLREAFAHVLSAERDA